MSHTGNTECFLFSSLVQYWPILGSFTPFHSTPVRSALGHSCPSEGQKTPCSMGKTPSHVVRQAHKDYSTSPRLNIWSKVEEQYTRRRQMGAPSVLSVNCYRWFPKVCPQNRLDVCFMFRDGHGYLPVSPHVIYWPSKVRVLCNNHNVSSNKHYPITSAER